jgi:hypothetical protein
MPEIRLVGFQQEGDIHPAGGLHDLMTQVGDINRLLYLFINPIFSKGMVAWSAITAFAKGASTYSIEILPELSPGRISITKS